VKTETLVARVTPELAKKVQDAATRAGETDAFVIREALREYFARRDTNVAAVLQDAPNSTPAVQQAEAQAVQAAEQHIASYRKSARKPRAK